MEKYYAALDMGASSCRLMLGSLIDGKLELEEVHRFENGMVEKDGELCWEYDRLFKEIIIGLKKYAEIGKIPQTLGIDTWGVDFVLLDSEDQLLGNPVGYRDPRQDGMIEEVEKYISAEELYARTGLEKISINTIYHLMAVCLKHPDHIKRAETFLMVPDYFNFLLTGEKKNEYTEATTTGLINAATDEWDTELIEKIGLKKEMFCEIIKPGTKLGNLRKEIVDEIGYDLEVIAPCTHDTAAAVLAVPSQDKNIAYISSGTWSLMGALHEEKDCSELSRTLNFTNEGAYGGKVCYHKNLMGLYMIQSLRHETGDAYSYQEICEMADAAKEFPSRIDPNAPCFRAPVSMTEEIKKYCRETGQRVPQTLGETATVVYASLAECYAKLLKMLETQSGGKYTKLHVIGGGSKATYLNEMTAKYCGVDVYAGPKEATAIGNIMAQMIAFGDVADEAEARDCVYRSFGIQIYPCREEDCR